MKKQFAVTALALALAAAGCGKGSEPSADFPNRPEMESLSLPGFVSYTPAVSSKRALGKAAACAPGDTTHTHVTMAVLGVGYWTFTFNVAMLPPRMLFWNSFSVEPEENGDGTWQWNVDYGVFTARLVATPLTDSTRWAMYVTGEGLDDFKWYDGVSTENGTNGTWTFYDTSATGMYPATLRITYDRDASEKFLRAEVVDPADTCFGNFLEWTASGDERAFHIYDAHNTDPDQPDSVSVTWNDVDESGSINDLRTGMRYCWDTKANGHKDVECAVAK